MRQYWRWIAIEWLAVVSLVVTGVLFVGQTVVAQAPPVEGGLGPAPAPEPAPVAPAEPAPADPEPEIPVAQEPSATPLPEPPAAAATPVAPVAPISIPDGEAPPAPVAPAFPPAIPNVDVAARLRTATRFQDYQDPESFGDISQQVDADFYANGQVHRMLKWQVGVTISYPGSPGSSNAITVAPLDIIARFEPLPEFNIYMGRMIVVADRYTPSGPWGMDEFFYPGVFPALPAALQKSGPTGRDLGVNIWGAPLGGHLKYYLGIYQLHDPNINPLLSGRLQLSLLSPEPAFYQRTTYFGTKDLVAFGIGGQYQKAGSVMTVPTPMAGMMPVVPMTDDFSFFTADVTIDKVLGDSGTASLGGSYMMWKGDYNRWDNFFLASAGYLLPGVYGIGKIRFALRYQRGMATNDDAEASSIIDAQVSYNVMAWFARFQLGYRRIEQWIPGAPAQLQAGNQIYLGVTLADP